MSSVRSELSACEAKRRLNLSGDCQVVGYAGRLAPIKRLDVFLAAAKEISRRRPETQFVIVGEGIEDLRLRQIAAASGLSSRVLFLGHRDDIYDVLRAFDIFVLCSDHEGLPMVLLEALYLGVPVVARRVGGIPEVLQDEVSGLLVDSADPRILAEACLRILNDSGLRTRLAEAGCSRMASAFSAEQTADRVSDLYLSLCKPGRETR
jgi:glycosyltransferase involved in cell wall biosynthesis